MGVSYFGVQTATCSLSLFAKLTLLLVPAFLPLAARVTSADPLLPPANGHALLATPVQLMETPVAFQVPCFMCCP